MHLRKSDRRPLYKMLSKLKKRGAITEIPGGRYQLGGRKGDADRPPLQGTEQARFAGTPAAGGSLIGLRYQSISAACKSALTLPRPGHAAAWSSTTMATASSSSTHRRRNSTATSSFRVTQSKTPCTAITCRQNSSRRLQRRARGRPHLRVLNRAQPSGSRPLPLRRGAANYVCPTTLACSIRRNSARRGTHSAVSPEKLGLSDADERNRRAKPPHPAIDELDGAVVNVELLRFPAKALPPPDASSKFSAVPAKSASTSRSSFASISCRTFSRQTSPPKPSARASIASEATAQAAKIFAHLPIVTIDGETARDFDDAVYVSAAPTAGGNCRFTSRTSRITSHRHAARSAKLAFAAPRLFSRSRRAHASRRAFQRHVLAEAARRSPGHERAHGIRRARQHGGARMTRESSARAERMTYTNVNKVLEGDAETDRAIRDARCSISAT